jgi:hypothetical protein
MNPPLEGLERSLADAVSTSPDWISTAKTTDIADPNENSPIVSVDWSVWGVDRAGHGQVRTHVTARPEVGALTALHAAKSPTTEFPSDGWGVVVLEKPGLTEVEEFIDQVGVYHHVPPPSFLLTRPGSSTGGHRVVYRGG